jgi:hypothetical protein
MSSENEFLTTVKGFIKEIDFGLFMIVVISAYLMISGQAKPTAAFVVGAYMYFQQSSAYGQFTGYFERWKASL